MTHRFVNYHVLISHPSSCLNRDDMNMQKSAVFGGVRRVRISSQCLKRAIRQSDYYQEHFGQPSVRTKQLGELYREAVEALGDRFDTDLINRALQLATDKTEIKDGTEGDAVAPWLMAEIAFLCEAVQEAESGGLKDKKLKKAVFDKAEGFRRASATALDLALSGRMATSGLMSELGKIEGALAVAHVLTTHAVDAEVDWFTAVDDLKDLGSGHLDTQEISAGVFYRYASLNLGQLEENLCCDRERALDIAAHLLHMLTTVVPTAKARSTAAFNFADFAMVSLSEIPVSFANAFERPVSDRDRQGLMRPSIEALTQYCAKLGQGYGFQGEHACFAVDETVGTGGTQLFTTLRDLQSWLRGDGEAAA